MKNSKYFVFLLFLCIPAVYCDDWSRFLGPGQDGVSAETGLLENWGDDGLGALWRKEIGTGYSAPSILGNQLVIHHRIGNEEIVECFDANDASPVWRYAYPSHFIDPYGYNNGPRCSPLLTEEYCYTHGAEGVLTCVSMKDGSRVWQRDTHQDWEVAEAFFGVGSTPVLVDGLLICLIGGQPNSGVVAFNPQTGETVWESVGRDTWQGKPMVTFRGNRTADWQDHWQIADYSSPIVADIHGKQHVICLMRQGLVSVDPKDGTVNFCLWHRAEQHESVNAMSPVVSGDLVFISSAYYKTGSVVVRVLPDGKSIEEAWRGTQMECHWDQPKIIDGFLYGFSGRNDYDSTLRCVELATGEVKWITDGVNSGDEAGVSRTYRTEAQQRFGRGSAIYADGKLILLGERGTLALAKPSPDQYEEISRFKVPNFEYPCWTAPVLANKRLYVRNEKWLVCFDLGQ